MEFRYSNSLGPNVVTNERGPGGNGDGKLSGEPSRSETVIVDRMMTCPACSQVMKVDEASRLPAHFDWRETFFGSQGSACPGSFTLAFPHRHIREIKPLTITMLPDDNDATAIGRNVSAIIECARFLNRWLGEDGMRVDNVQLAKIVARTTDARQGALNLMRT